MTTLLSTQDVQKLFHYRSRSAFHRLFARDVELQACAIRVGHRVLFDPKRLDRYIQRRRFVKDTLPAPTPE